MYNYIPYIKSGQIEIFIILIKLVSKTILFKILEYNNYMHFLQTSDWHLGRLLFNTSILEDQKQILNQIITQIEIASKNGNEYDALLIPGDIYDRANPPKEAMTVLSDFLTELSNKFPKLQVFILSGNHDDAKLLYFAKDFFKKANIHFCTDLSDIENPVILTSAKDDSEKAAIYQIPYLEAYAFADLRRQQELYEKATESIEKTHKNYDECLSVICAHLFAIKSIVNDAERSSVGPAEEVDTKLFEKFDYTALGHIHSYQPCGTKNNIFYSGSPLKFNPDNKDKENKFLLDITVSKNQKPEIKKIPLIAPHKITTITGSYADYYGKNAKEELIEPYKNDYIVFICTDDILPDSPMQNLKTVFPFIRSFRMEEKERNNSTNFAEERLARQSIIEEFESKPENLFEKFLEDINANTKDEELEKKEKELFLKYIKIEQE